MDFLKVFIKIYLPMLNYYEILEIPHNATKDEIKSAFRKMARKFHPDVNKDFGAEVKFKRINLAAQTLLDDKLRENYDFAFGFSKFSNEEINKKAQDAREAYKKASFDYRKTTQEKKEENDFQKKFHEFFSKKEKEQQKPKEINGDDIISDVYISQKEALCGTVRKVNILESEKCPKCFGAKFSNGTKCSFCNGLGEKTQYKKLSVKIPQNIKNNAKIRVKGQGEKGKFGGRDGDLYLIVHIDENSKYEVIDKITYLDVPIQPYEAVLGADIEIPAPCGKIKLKIPAGAKNNATFKLLNCGVADKTTGKNGTLVVKVVIDISDNLSDKEKELYKKLSEFSNNIREELFKKYE